LLQRKIGRNDLQHNTGQHEDCGKTAKDRRRAPELWPTIPQGGVGNCQPTLATGSQKWSQRDPNP
jgi:hypothetical protein